MKNYNGFQEMKPAKSKILKELLLHNYMIDHGFLLNHAMQILSRHISTSLNVLRWCIDILILSIARKTGNYY